MNIDYILYKILFQIKSSIWKSGRNSHIIFYLICHTSTVLMFFVHSIQTKIRIEVYI